MAYVEVVAGLYELHILVFLLETKSPFHSNSAFLFSSHY
jgi:hypothetical protein